MIFITNAELLLEYDESDLTMDQTKDKQHSVVTKKKIYKAAREAVGKKKARKAHVRIVKKTDSLANKMGLKASGVGGSLGSGHQMRPAIVLPGESWDARWEDADGTCPRIAARMPNGELLSCTFMAAGKGGSNKKVGVTGAKPTER